MAEEEVEEGAEDVPKKKSKLPMLLGLVLAIALGGGGFFAVYSGMILASESPAEHSEDTETKEMVELPDVSFIEIDPIVINLGVNSSSGHLKFHAQLEVEPSAEDEIEKLKPRVVDVMNGYLRAISTEQLEEPSALIKIRAQLLRRIQIVTGEGRVRDLLIMEFVLN